MKRIRSLVILVLIVFVFCFTVPSREKHEDAIAKSFKQDNTILGKIGAGALYSKMFEYRNYYVCSLMLLSNEVESVGLVGFVFVL